MEYARHMHSDRLAPWNGLTRTFGSSHDHAAQVATNDHGKRARNHRRDIKTSGRDVRARSARRQRLQPHPGRTSLGERHAVLRKQGPDRPQELTPDTVRRSERSRVVRAG